MADERHASEQQLPALAAFVLTHRLPCAALLLTMLVAAVWVPVGLQGLPQFLLLIASLLAVTMHMMTPAVVAVVAFGGGLLFAGQVSALMALGVVLIAGFSWLAGLAVFVLYGLLPMLAAMLMSGRDGMRRSAEWLALLVALVSVVGLWLAAVNHGLGIEALVKQWLRPLFDAIRVEMPASEAEAAIMLEQMRGMMAAIFPGLLMVGLWFAWWSNVVLARSIAVRYSFYRGDTGDFLTLRFEKPVAYIFVGLLVLANIATADIHYLAVNLLILVAGLLAVQGVAVSHSWLKAKGMLLSIVLMYFLLVVWSMMVVPFIIIGLMDIWFDYRRNIPAAGG